MHHSRHCQCYMRKQIHSVCLLETQCVLLSFILVSKEFLRAALSFALSATAPYLYCSLI